MLENRTFVESANIGERGVAAYILYAHGARARKYAQALQTRFHVAGVLETTLLFFTGITRKHQEAMQLARSYKEAAIDIGKNKRVPASSLEALATIQEGYRKEVDLADEHTFVDVIAALVTGRRFPYNPLLMEVPPQKAYHSIAWLRNHLST